MFRFLASISRDRERLFPFYVIECYGCDHFLWKKSGGLINREINGEIRGIGDRLVVHPDDGLGAVVPCSSLINDDVRSESRAIIPKLSRSCVTVGPCSQGVYYPAAASYLANLSS